MVVEEAGLYSASPLMLKTFAIFLAAAAFLITPASADPITMAWSPVTNSGNAVDPLTGLGSVPYNYSIGTYDVTNSQYTAFLNAKDPSGANTLDLYYADMGLSAAYGGISFNVTAPNGSKYSVISGDGNHPVNNETFFDAIRFANWMNNGQGNGDTETGAYTLLGGTPTPSNADTIARNAGATVFIPSENEWYKAAYYNPATSSYYQYSTSSNTVPTATSPPGSVNAANYGNSVNGPTNVGAYTLSASPYGVFDMGGNVWQWDETSLRGGSFRGTRGGAFDDTDPADLSTAAGEIGFYANTPIADDGFRVAMIPTGWVPEPSSGALAFIACGLMWLCRRRTFIQRAR